MAFSKIKSPRVLPLSVTPTCLISDKHSSTAMHIQCSAHVIDNEV